MKVMKINIAQKCREFYTKTKALLVPPKGLHQADVFVIWGIMAFFFFWFVTWDCVITSSQSYAYLEGHIIDFSSYNRAVTGTHINYLQPMYLIFALWNLPLKLFGLTTNQCEENIGLLSAAEITWVKLLVVVFFAVCAVTVYKIALLIASKEKLAKLSMFLFASSPLTIFTIFAFGAYDIFGVTFTMLGLYAFLRHKRWQFMLWFSLALPLKFFAFLPFLPLLLLDEKNAWKILRSLLVVIAPTLACFAWFLLDQGSTPLLLLGDLGISSLDLGSWMKPSVFALAYLAVCLFAYFKCVDDDRRQRQKYAIMLPLAGLSLIFVCTFWHHQWIILLTPWLALAFLFSPNKTYSLLFETAGIAAMFMRLLNSHARVPANLLQNYWLDPSGFYYVDSPFKSLQHFLQAGIFFVGAIIPNGLLPYIDAAILGFLLSPFLLMLLERKKIIWPIPRMFKTEAGYLRLRCYGGMAAFFLPIVATSVLYIWLPDLFEKIATF